MALIVIGVLSTEFKSIVIENWKRAVKILLGFLFFMATYHLLYSGDITAQSIRQRVGPDMLGWVASAQYIEREWSEKNLTNWLSDSFPKHPEVDAFGKENFGTRNSIYYTDEYTKQLQAEFLIGADRDGLPAYMGWWMTILPDAFGWKHVYLSLITIFSLLLFVGLIQRRSGNALIPFLISCGLLFSFQLLLPVFEGGLGQAFSFLIFFYVLSPPSKPISKAEYVILLLVTLFAYRDLLFFGFLLFFAWRLFWIEDRSKGLLTRRQLGFVALSMPLAIPVLFAFDIDSRIRSLSFGGWSEGWMPSLLDVIGVGGIYSWAKLGDTGFLYGAFSLIVSASILYLLVNRFKGKMPQLLSILFMFMSFSIISMISLIVKNDYSLWKALPYYAIFVSLLVISTLQNEFIPNPRLFVVLQWIFALCFFIAWRIESKAIEIYNLPEREEIQLREIVDSYALDFRQVEYINTFSILGDMSWGMDGRQVKDQVAKRSSRKVVTVIPTQICREAPDKELILFLSSTICVVDVSVAKDSN